MLSLRLVAVAAFLGRYVCSTDDIYRPHFVNVDARAKQHRKHTGGLVGGEEHLRKIILRWNKIPDAEAYEMCHNCRNIDEATGSVTSDDLDAGTIIPLEVGRKNECGGIPCMVMPSAPKGYNKFNLRVKKDGEWSAWSENRNYNIQEPGQLIHEEL
jgi:hypothetical protein